jgi:hypothetical protein
MLSMIAELGFSFFLVSLALNSVRSRATSDSEAFKLLTVPQISKSRHDNISKGWCALHLGTEVDIHFTLLGSGQDSGQNT